MLRQTLSLGSPSGRMELHQKLAPPIANSTEEVKSHKVERKELSDELLRQVSYFVENEFPSRPYSDLEILEHIRREGYQDIDRIDIARARSRLRIKPSSQRYFK